MRLARRSAPPSPAAAAALKLLLWRNGTAWTLRGLLTNSNRKAARSHPLALRKPLRATARFSMAGRAVQRDENVSTYGLPAFVTARTTRLLRAVAQSQERPEQPRSATVRPGDRVLHASSTVVAEA